MTFVLSGLLVFTDKVTDEEQKRKVRDWIMMTGVARLFEIEKEQAVERAVMQVSAEKDAIIEQNKAEIEQKDAALAQMSAEIRELRALLAQA